MNLMSGYITAFFLPLMVALLITPWVIKFAYKVGAVDIPEERKVHTTIKPRLGGLAIFLSVLISSLALFFIFPDLYQGLLDSKHEIIIVSICLISIFLLGVWDDIRSLNPGIKFFIQFVIASFIYFIGFKISNITNPVAIGMLNVEMIDFPLTLLWIVGITNAYNLIDGLDGLATGVAIIACFSIFTVSIVSGYITIAVLTLILAGALAGFLRYNFNPAKIFLGDSGSLLIGFSLSILSIQSAAKITTGFSLLFPMLVLILPITDTIISMSRRFIGSYLPGEYPDEKQSFVYKIYKMFIPDRAHIHHQLISLGLTHRATVLLLYFVSAFFALSAISFSRINNIEKSIVIALFIGFVLFLCIKKLRYHEIAILNNGLMMPIYERWILNRTIFLSLIDTAFITLSCGLSYKLIQSINPEYTEALSLELLMIIVLPVQLVVFWITGIYRENIRQLGIGNAMGITASIGYAVMASLFALMFIYPHPLLLSQILIIDFYFLLTFILGIRIAYQVLRYLFVRENITGEKVLIYGANEDGTMILHKINNSPVSSIKVAGFLDDDRELESQLIYGYPILGGHWKLNKILRKYDIDSIFLCEDSIKPENFNRLQRIAAVNHVKLKRLDIRLEDVATSQNGYEPITKSVNGSIFSVYDMKTNS